MHANPASPDYVLVICGSCQARLHPRRALAGKVIACPDCGRRMRVPSDAPPTPAATPKQRDPGVYAVTAPTSTPREPQCFLLVCPTCSARLHPSVEQVGRKVRCPDCDRTIVVPPPPTPRRSPKLAAPGSYHVGETRAERPAPKSDFLLRTSILEPEAASPPPRIWYASGVWSFPWRGDAFGRWLFLCLLFLPTCGLTALALSAGEGRFSAVAFGAFAMSAAIMWIWTLAYASACYMGIVIDTAAGIQDVAQWPDADWREWLWPMLYVGFMFCCAAGVAVGMAYGVGLGLADSIVLMHVVRGGIVMGVTYLLFPPLLISALERDNPFLPISKPVFASLPRQAGSWLLFYAFTGLLCLPLAGMVLLAVPFMTVSLLLSGPLMASAVFLHARLLGRLAWRIGLSVETARAADK